ncbi:hypothetical protein BJ508DRAFT_315918 [Ascobolus immersus RN42]|uniref:Uncharacterized protein n=1 Tax=Ascobolus immersus RN42 TaxID=1160509 RepID=A0A3N4HDL2_ASCIM|nr:hypothetical protein BJ508DRAFT_315918 [Ascobolus immersus RN42]
MGPHLQFVLLHMSFPRSAKSSPYDHISGSPLNILKIIASRMTTDPFPGSQDHDARKLTILSSSEKHITLKLQTGLVFTLTEDSYGKAKIRRFSFVRPAQFQPDSFNPDMLQRRIERTTGGPDGLHHILDALRPQYTKLPIDQITKPSLNFHLTYRPSASGFFLDAMALNMKLPFDNTYPGFELERQNRSRFEMRVTDRDQIGHIFAPSTEPVLLAHLSSTVTHSFTGRATIENIASDVETLLLAVSLLMELESSPTQQAEEVLTRGITENLTDPDGNPPVPSREGLPPFRRVAARTVSVSQTVFQGDGTVNN